MTRLLNWLSRFVRWFFEPRTFWLCAFVIAAVCTFAIALPKPLEDDIRYAGLALQLLGVATVMRGLRDRGRLFDKPPIVTSIKAWLSTFPPYSPKSVTLSASGSATASATATMTAVVWRAYRDGDTIDERFLALARNLDTVRQELSDASTRLSNQVGSVQEALRGEQSSRTVAIDRLSRKLTDLGSGTLHIELIGIVWLVSGIVLATIPAELALLFTVHK
jgi:hypothetical protein